jgi:hypothetical protein
VEAPSNTAEPTSESPAPVDPEDAEEIITIDGFFVDLNTAQYFDSADAVVRAVVTDQSTHDLEVPAGSELAGADEQTLTVQVKEVLDGSAPPLLTVSRLVSTEELYVDGSFYTGPLEVGQEYVLVLNTGHQATGSEGEYVLVGENPVAAVEGDAVSAVPSLSQRGASSSQRDPVPLDRLREAADKAR